MDMIVIGMKWRVAQAKQNFSELLRRAAREPQVILNRDHPVAIVMAGKTFEEFTAWSESRKSRPLADVLGEAAKICEEEDYTFEAPERLDRANPLIREQHSAPRRHKRSR
jgi:prevent-host-death family protein